MNKVSNKHAYNTIADQWTNERNQSAVSKLIIEFGNKVNQAGNILDLGCGSGIPNAIYLSERGFNLTGIDVSPKMIEIAKANDIKNAVFEISDMLEYTPRICFDGILAWDSLFHLPFEAQYNIYAKISKWLNKDGWLLFSHTGADGEIIEDMYGEDFYYSGLSTGSVKRLLVGAGFEITTIKENYEERDMQKALVVMARKLD